MKNSAMSQRSRSIYLVRHGDAAASVEDPARPLTKSGGESVRRLATWAGAVGLKVDRILHSGKLRAEQTAEILTQYLKPPRGVGSSHGLQPNDDVGYVDDLIQTEADRLLIVGHLPHLGRLAAYLITGDADRSVVQFEAAALVELVQRDDGWRIRCVVQPDMLRSL